MEATWIRAQECAKDWADNAGTFSGSIESLSPAALAAFHTLRVKGRLPMCPELMEVLLEMNGKGLLEVRPEGYATMKVSRKGLHVPKAEPLKIERIKIADRAEPLAA